MLDLQNSAIPQKAAGSPTPTFTRATPKTITDFEGRSVLLRSGEIGFTGARRVRNLFSTGATEGIEWTLAGTSAPTQELVAKDGKTNVLAVTFPSGASSRGESVAQSFGGSEMLAAVQSGRTYRVSFLIALSRALEGSEALRVQVDGGVGATTPLDFSTSLDPGTTLIRVSNTTTFVSSNSDGIYINPTAALGADLTVYVTEWQIEDVTGQSNQAPGEYVPVGVASAPFYGCGIDGVQCFNTLNGNTVTDNVVTEATGAPITDANSDYAGAYGPFGYNAEVARTNSALHSRKLAAGVTATAWTVSNITAADEATGIDGVANACSTLTATANGGTILQAITLASAAAIFQPFVKRKTGTGTIEITLNGGTNWTDITAAVDAAAPGWYSLAAVTATLANPSIGYRLGTSGDEIEVDMNDCQNGTFRSSPIPTTTAAVTRNAEIDAYATASNLNAAAMTIALDFIPEADAMGTVYLFGSYVDADNGTAILHDGTNIIARKRIGGVNADATIALDYDANTVYRVVARFDAANGVDVWLDGTKGTGDAEDAACQLGATFQVGADGNSLQQACGSVRRLSVYPQGLSDAQAAAL